MQNILCILISLISIIIALAAFVLSIFFNSQANEFARELSRLIIKETTKEDVDPILKYGKLIGKNIIKVINEKVTIGEKIVK